jgi:uncharacterized protein YyaL (SSP411 family)
MPTIDWLSWSSDAFDRARIEGKPILLSISASWCHWCHEMDRTTYGDGRVAGLIGSSFVPIRVDADRRPDISERYQLGGLPTTAFLTADGDVIAGGNYIPPDRMSGVLEQVARAVAGRQEEMAARAGQVAVHDVRGADAEASLDRILTHTFETYDATFGGFGTEPKFPHIAPILLALDIYQRSGDGHMRMIAETTLDAMADGGLYDAVDGGFFRYATTRDWQLPHDEKLLEVNAALLALYVRAAQVFASPRYRELAAALVRYAGTWLADPDGGWWGSQSADRRYYALPTVDARRGAASPAVDMTLYAGWNSAMASAHLHAAHLLGDSHAGELAMASLERIFSRCYAPGGGIAHYFDGHAQVRGLLDDQIAAIEAALDGYEATGNITYEMVAEEVGHYLIRTMWDPESGGFFDRADSAEAPDVGLLRTRLKPFVANCEASRVLFRLGVHSGNHDFGDKARGTLAAMHGLAIGRGPQAAHYLLAVREGRTG